MRVRYYVRTHGSQFQVLREGRPQGLHGSKLRAHHAAVFMATVEAAAQKATAEIFVEDAAGRLVQERVIGPDDYLGASLAAATADEARTAREVAA